MTVADGKVLMREIYITNEGSLTGEFKIRYSGNQPITIMPSGGIIKSGARQFVKVSLTIKYRVTKSILEQENGLS